MFGLIIQIIANYILVKFKIFQKYTFTQNLSLVLFPLLTFVFCIAPLIYTYGYIDPASIAMDTSFIKFTTFCIFVSVAIQVIVIKYVLKKF